MLLQSFYFKYVIMGRFSLEMFLGGLYVFIRARFIGFLDVHGYLAAKKGQQVMRSGSSMWVGAQGPVFYKVF